MLVIRIYSDGQGTTRPQASKHRNFRFRFGRYGYGTVRQRLSAVAPVLACARDVRMFLSPETARGREQAGARVDE